MSLGVFLSVQFLEEFEKDLCKLFFVCLVEFTCETIWSSTFVCREFLFFIFIYLFLKCIIFKNLFYLFCFWLHWVFIAVCGLSQVAASRGYSSLWCVGFSLRWLLFVVEHNL